MHFWVPNNAYFYEELKTQKWILVNLNLENNTNQIVKNSPCPKEKL